jgi:hypothetical protein
LIRGSEAFERGLHAQADVIRSDSDTRPCAKAPSELVRRTTQFGGEPTYSLQTSVTDS